MSAEARGKRYRLYVVELGRFPGVDGRPAVYVGSTSQTARARFDEHLRGGFTSASRVRRYGTRLLPELVRGERLHATRESAEGAEVRLAIELAEAGYRVFGASGRPMPAKARQPLTTLDM